MLPWLVAILAIVGIFLLWRGYQLIRGAIIRRRVAYMLFMAALNPHDRERFEDHSES